MEKSCPSKDGQPLLLPELTPGAVLLILTVVTQVGGVKGQDNAGRDVHIYTSI